MPAAVGGLPEESTACGSGMGLAAGRGHPAWGGGFGRRGVGGPCSRATGHQVALLSAKYRRRWQGPSSGRQTAAGAQEGPRVGSRRGPWERTMSKWWKKAIRSCFPREPIFLPFFFSWAGRLWCQKAVISAGARKPQAASEGLAVLLRQGIWGARRGLAGVASTPGLRAATFQGRGPSLIPAPLGRERPLLGLQTGS